MSKWNLLLALMLGSVLALPAAAQSVPDVSGDDWNWSNVETLRLPREFLEGVGAGLGVTPEGENTFATCESSGSMELAQSGATFWGTASRTFNLCETQGGQFFQQPQTALFIVDGVITGNGARFSHESPTVHPCPHHVVLTAIDNDGRVTTMSGTGRCILPGHPQSSSPAALPPPPGGTSKVLNWEASRP